MSLAHIARIDFGEGCAENLGRLGLPDHPRELKLSREEGAGALLTLRAQTREDRRWGSIIVAEAIGGAFVEAACQELHL